MFRTTGTLAIDEFEGIQRKGTEALKELLNSAYKKGSVVKRLIDEDKIKLATRDQADKYFTDQLISEGYQGVKHPDMTGGTHYQIFDPKVLLKEKVSRKKLIEDQVNSTDRMVTAQKNAALPVEKGGLGLAPDNTQWQRAEAMGFNVREPMYHGTQKEFTQFDLAKHGSATDKGDFGEAVYASTNPETANTYARDAGDYTSGQVMPLYVKEGKRLVTQGQNEFNKLIERLGGEEAWFEMRNHPKKYAQAIKDLGYDSVRDMGYHQTAIFDPKNIRSKFR
jgi:hypothetical protein